jgi:isocitrate dehydrogenase
MTKDLAICIHGEKTTAADYLTTTQFLDEVAARLSS